MTTTALSSVQFSSYYAQYQSSSYVAAKQPNTGGAPVVVDTLDLGKDEPLSREQTNALILERAFNKLRSVVDEARAELGIPEGAELDTSAEATAQRIGDFALNFFDKYLQQHPELEGDDARMRFAEFIGGAINQGIEEARGILRALSALNPEVTSKIDSIGELIKKRLDDFVAGKDSSRALV